MKLRPGNLRAVGSPWLVLMDHVELFDPVGGLPDWVRGPWAKPARLLVASWGRGPMARLGLRHRDCVLFCARRKLLGQTALAFIGRKPKPEWPDLGSRATLLSAELGFVPRTHRHTGWLRDRQLAQP
jgi:hypothetical protein